MPRNERTLPEAIEVEQTVLGAMMTDREAAITCQELLTPECFVKDAHKLIYSTMLALLKECTPVDIITVTDRLNRNGRLVKAGGAEYLAELLSLVDSSVNAEHYARIIIRKHMLRGIIKLGTRVIEDAFKEIPPEDLLDTIDRDSRDIRGQNVVGAAQPIGKVLIGSLADIESAMNKGGIIGASSGLKRLDELLSGFKGGELIYLAGRPSDGKTALAFQWETHVAKAQIGDGAVLFFSLEMGARALGVRLLALESGIDSNRLRCGKIDPQQVVKISEITGLYGDIPLYIDDTSGLTPASIRARCQKLAQDHPLALVVVDYIGLVELPGKHETQNLKIAEISKAFKNMAKTLNVPILVLCQLSRNKDASSSRGGIWPKQRRYVLSDLRDSGAQEADADVVIFVWREDGNPTNYYREIIVAKQRNGPTGIIPCIFKPEIGRLYEEDQHHEESQEPPY